MRDIRVGDLVTHVYDKQRFKVGVVYYINSSMCRICVKWEGMGEYSHPFKNIQLIPQYYTKLAELM